MATTFESVEKEIESGKLKPIYLLKGEETYYLRLLTESFEKKILDEAEADFNLSVFYGKDASMEQIMLTSKQYPVMAQKRVVILKEAQTMDKRELVKVEKYLQAPLATTVLVIVSNGADFSTPLATKIGKVGTVFDSKKIREEKLISWIDGFVKQQGFVIEQRASALISDYIGNDLLRISNELSKLMIDLSGRKQITIDDVSSHIGVSKQYNVFELQRAIGQLDYGKIDRCVNYMADNPKENPLPVIFANIFAFFAKLLIVAQLPEKSDQTVAAAIKVSPYFAKDYSIPAQRYPLEKIIQNISLIRQYELKSKGVDYFTLSEDGGLLKEFIYKLTH